MHGFKNSFAQVFSLKSRSTISNICSCMFTNLLPTPTALPPFFDIQIWILCQFVKKIHSPPPPPPHPPPPPQKKKSDLDSLSISQKKIHLPPPPALPLTHPKHFFSLFFRFGFFVKTVHSPSPPTPTSPPPEFFFFRFGFFANLLKKKTKTKKKTPPPPPH